MHIPPGTRTDVHRECWAVLPWFVTGRLSAEQRALIEQHLLDCAACREEFEQQRMLCEYVRADAPIMLAPQASLQKLMARIDRTTENVSVEERPASPTQVASEPPRKQRPHWIAIAACLQAIAIGALLMVVWQQHAAQLTEPRYTTLSAPAALPQSEVILRIVFRPEMTNAELLDLLHSIDAQIISGPTEAGVYSLRLRRAVRASEVAHVLAQLRASSNVVFAEHVSAELSP